MDALYFAIVVIWAVVTGIVRLVKWLNKTIAAMTSPPPSQLLAAQQAPVEPPAPPLRPAAPTRRAEPPPTPPRSESQRPAMQDTTTSSLNAFSEMSDAAGSTGASDAPKLDWPADRDTFIRALILSETLGPPLSRRRR